MCLAAVVFLSVMVHPLRVAYAHEAPEVPVTVAVLGVDLGGVSRFPDGTDKLLTDLLTIELSRWNTLEVVERDRLGDLLEEKVRYLSGQIDRPHPESPVRFRGWTSVEFLVQSSAFTYEDQLTVSIRLTETATGVVHVVVYEGGGPRPFG